MAANAITLGLLMTSQGLTSAHARPHTSRANAGPAAARPVVRLRRGGVPVYTAPGSGGLRKGLIGGPNSVFPLLGRARGSGCRRTWLRIGHKAWVCPGLAHPGMGQPGARKNPRVSRGRLLPRRWYAVTRHRTTVRSRPTQTAPLVRFLTRGSGLIVRPRIRTKHGTWRRSRLGFIKAAAVRFTRPSRFKGVVLGGSNRLPVSWINGAGARTTRTPGAKRRSGRLKPYARVTVLATRTVGRRRYTRTGPNQWVKGDRVRTARFRQAPPGLKPGEKWIHVNLAEWTLTAYAGTKPVFATVVSPGNNTPRGRYRITRKLATATLGWKTKNGVYEAEGVPWVMYFKPHFAFHAAYWHDLFGFVESHGCINLSPADARRLFEWAAPSLPAGWYNIRGTPSDPGTLVLIK